MWTLKKGNEELEKMKIHNKKKNLFVELIPTVRIDMSHGNLLAKVFNKDYILQSSLSSIYTHESEAL